MQKKKYFLEILKELYFLYNKYPDDKKTRESIGTIAWTLEMDLDFAEYSFMELAELANYHDSNPDGGKYYKGQIAASLTELEKINQIIYKEHKKELAAHDAIIAKLPKHLIIAYYTKIVDNKVIKSVAFQIFMKNKKLVIDPKNDEVSQKIYNLLHSVVEKQPDVLIETLAKELPYSVDELVLRNYEIIGKEEL